MIDAPLALAFTSGLVATVNPCGFAMLPAYLSYFIGIDDGGRSQVAAMRRALTTGAVVSSGFLLVFGVVGLLVTLGLSFVVSAVPWVAIIIGAALVALGIAMLRGYELKVALPGIRRANKDRGLSSVFVFGISYAIASLSCTLPVFLAVVAGTITRTNLVAGTLTFLVYGLGMSLVLMVVTVALALGKNGLVGRLRASARYVNRIAGVILLLAGAYIVYYWVFNLTTPPTQQAGSAPLRIVESLSASATTFIGENALIIGVVSGAVLLLAIAYTVFRSRNRVDRERVGPGPVGAD